MKYIYTERGLFPVDNPLTIEKTKDYVKPMRNSSIYGVKVYRWDVKIGETVIKGCGTGSEGFRAATEFLHKTAKGLITEDVYVDPDIPDED